MLYITTKSDKDAFTAYKALHDSYCADGGRYIPFRLPVYEQTDILALKEKNFGQVLSEILNVFFSCRISSWDVDFSIGRNCLKISDAGNKVVVAELWHNLGNSYTYIVQKLYEEVVKNAEQPTDWFRIASEIAVLFGIYSELLKTERISHLTSIDLSLPLGNFSSPIAAWYARKMGLPIGTIICTCEDSALVWDLIHRGSFSTTNAAQDLRHNVARLIQGTLGYDALKVFYEKCDSNLLYTVDEESLPILNSSIFCSVAGKDRPGSIINSVYRNSGYISDPNTAMCYGGVQDYRSKTGCNNLTVLLSKESALSHSDEIMQATGIPETELANLINRS